MFHAHASESTYKAVGPTSDLSPVILRFQIPLPPGYKREGIGSAPECRNSAWRTIIIFTHEPKRRHSSRCCASALGTSCPQELDCIDGFTRQITLTHCLSKLAAQSAGPKLRAGFMLAPVSSPCKCLKDVKFNYTHTHTHNIHSILLSLF